MASNELERPLSALSISSSSKSADLDWNYHSSSASAPVTPSPRRRHVELPNVDGTPLARLNGTRRPLADLLRLHHAHKDADGHCFQALHLTEEEETRLREALDNWVSSYVLYVHLRCSDGAQVNSEDDDRSFHTLHDSDDTNSPLEQRTRSSTVNGHDNVLSEQWDVQDAKKATENA